jgi:hypothetical protein
LPPALRSLDAATPYRLDVSPHLVELADSIRNQLQLARV